MNTQNKSRTHPVEDKEEIFYSHLRLLDRYKVKTEISGKNGQEALFLFKEGIYE
jgi:hypothetical protein